jgi:arylsulfatase A-like enzyme
MVGFQTVPWEPETTLPRELSAAGYETAIVGRNMHQYRPDSHYGFEYVSEDYQHYLDAGQPEGGGGSFGHGVSGNGWTARPWHLPEHLHYTHWVVNEAIRFLHNRDRTRPFFLVVSFVAPHPPLVPPAFYMDRYLRQELPEPAIGDWAEPPANGGRGLEIDTWTVDLKGEALRSCQAGYFGLINHVDDQMHRMRIGLNQHGLARNTVTMLTADHGEMLGDHYLFRKTYAFEGSAHIPLLVSAPESFGLKAGQVRDEAVCLEDVMPTVLDLAGCAIPDSVQGRSLVPLLRGEPEAPWRPWLHGEHARCYSDAYNNHYLTDGREKYIWLSHSGVEMFFDLENDPREMHNLAGEPCHADRVAMWRGRLVKELRDRPEGFTDGQKLVPGRPHLPVPPAD